MLVKEFDFLDILNKRDISYKRASEDEYIILCPVCGKDNHFYFNIKKGLGICHKCKWACNGFTFLVVGLGYDKKDAVRLIHGSYDRSISGIRERIALLSNGGIVDDDFSEGFLYFKNPIPDSAVDVDPKRMPVVFKERRIPKKIALKYKPKIYNGAGVFSNRIIFPVKTLKNSTFVAISGFRKSRVEMLKKRASEEGRHYRKSLFPKGSIISEVLFGYNFIKKKKGGLFIVEGVWDLLTMESYGYNVTSTFGDKISLRQAYLLSKTNFDKLYIMLDGDVDKKRLKKYHKLLSDICIDKDIFVCMLPESKDPDDLSSEEVKRIIFNAKGHLF